MKFFIKSLQTGTSQDYPSQYSSYKWETLYTGQRSVCLTLLQICM